MKWLMTLRNHSELPGTGITAAVILLWLSQPATPQVLFGRQQGDLNGVHAVTAESSSAQERIEPAQPEAELRQGTALTSKGRFNEAIPHLLSAQGRVSNEYAASFNLALCYVGTRNFKMALQALDDLRRGGHDGADVEDLLAQAYIGNGQPEEGFASLKKAAAIAPQNERLYLFVADACMDRQDYALGLKVIEMGLQNVPQAARLHYERGMILSQMDEIDRAEEDFAVVSKLAAGSEIGYVSSAQKDLFDGNVSGAVQSARAGVSRGFQSPILLTILGQALLRSGVSPGQSDFDEAKTALERATAERPNDTSSQIALGQIYFLERRWDDAIAHLEKAREMKPGEPSVYASLAKAYQRRGESQKAQDALATLAQLNQQQAERIRSAPGDRKMSYGGSRRGKEKEPESKK